ncbi:tyrosine-type recombinase/integrase [Halorubrum aethiopicum]|uniref:tyrosine-type recombinase/integrase n=1 Tax=Halorubrum aethiopicum TaxID=1758255 RepID=UPI00082B469C|nr:site-specific integrase [Halorubrum aethiopicum]
MSESEYQIEIGGEADGGDRVPDLTPREAFERWMGRLRASKATSTVTSYHYQLKLFVEWCEEEGIATIGELTGWDIESYETERRNEGVELLSLNKEFRTLRLFLEYCARVELVDDDLPEKVDPPDVPRDAHVDETRLEHGRARMLLDYYDEHDYGSREHALLALAWYVGARLGGIRGLDLDDYDSDDAYLQFIHRPSEKTPLKNGRDGERAVGLPRHVCDTLDAYIAEHREEKYDDYGRRPLFTTLNGRMSQNSVRARMYLATQPCLHMECPHGNEREGCDYVDYTHGSKCPSSRSPHQVRTGSITWQLNRGVPIEVVAERVNTSVRVLKRHYDQPTKREELEERRREYVDRLGFGESGGEE